MHSLEYAFDDIGNRTTVGRGSRRADYSANALNQITPRDVPRYVNLLGSANSNATVTLWTGGGRYAPTTRQGDYFRGEPGTNNLSGPVWLTVTNLAVLNNGTNADIITNVVGNVFLAKTPETFAYDVDGNLTNDGHWTYTWDAENRLKQVESRADVPSASKRKMVWEYDGQGRRVRQTAYNGSSGSYVVTEDLKFVSDGWRHLAELNATNNALVRSYVWGLDLSGSQDGAGGVGGLLWINDTANGTHFAAFDGNGNITALVKATDGSVSASYEYDPFGEVLRLTGPMAQVNPFRFSTKFTEDETGLLYYGYRAYNPTIGRWLSRDPIEEKGGLLVYAFINDNPVNGYDADGRVAQIVGGAIVGCAVNAGWSLFTSFLSGDNACQCTCKAFGSCGVGAIAGAIAAATRFDPAGVSLGATDFLFTDCATLTAHHDFLTRPWRSVREGQSETLNQDSKQR